MNIEGYKLTKNGDIGLSTIQIGCDCGICGHRLESECIRNECKCCSNFHIRSG
jgi:hypothetical protein